MPPCPLTPIGVIRSVFRAPTGTPIQPVYAGDSEGTVEVDPAFADGLRDLAGFDRVWLLYWFDRAAPVCLRVVPFLDTVERGVFATRAPCRPNPIGLSCVRLISVDGNRLIVAGIDVLDGTPLLDIKPYVPAFDAHPNARAGWIGAATDGCHRSDGRFET